MNDWDDLLLTGGFAPREAILAGLTLEQVEVRPDEVPHSIYQELWHATMVLKISLDEGRAALERWPYEQHIPVTSAPANRQEWDGMTLSTLQCAVHCVDDVLNVSSVGRERGRQVNQDQVVFGIDPQQ
jgi:hypothetical protein